MIRIVGETREYVLQWSVIHFSFVHLGGWYVYLNTSLAALTSPLIPGANRMCYQMWYHMYGPKVGTLKVTFHVPGRFGKRTLWQKKGSVGPRWRHAAIDIPSTTKPFQVISEGC